MRKQKSKLLISAGIVLIVAGLAVWQLTPLFGEAQVSGQYYERQVSHNAGTSTSGYITENNAWFMSGAVGQYEGTAPTLYATSTFEVAVEPEFTKAFLGLFLVGSSSESGISITVEASNDNRAWYEVAILPTPTSPNDPEFNVATNTIYSFFPNQHSTSSVAIPVNLDNFVGQYLRFNFGAGLATSSLWAEFVAKSR